MYEGSRATPRPSGGHPDPTPNPMRPMRIPFLRRGRLAGALVAAAALAALACGDSTGPGSGSFSATITGATDRSYSGDALALAEANVGYALVLETAASEGPNQLEILLIRGDEQLPAPGTYDIVEAASGPLPTEFIGLLTIGFGEADERDCDAIEGTITFATTSSRRATGSFEFSMQCTLLEDPGAEPELATVEGTFDAITAMRL